MRTTSSLEALNGTIQKTFPACTHIYKFIENLRLHEACKSNDLYQLFMGNATDRQMERRRKNDRQREEWINIYSEDLKNEKISVFRFLRLVTKKILKSQKKKKSKT